MKKEAPNKWRRRWRTVRRILVTTTVAVVPIIIKSTDWGIVLGPWLGGGA